MSSETQASIINSVGIAVQAQISGAISPHANLLLMNWQNPLNPQSSCFSPFLKSSGTALLAFPGNNESAGKKKSVRITRAGVYLKPALGEIALAAVKSRATPYYQIKYERISKHKGKKRAIVAIARMILTAVFHMLSCGEVQEKELQKSLRRAAKLLVVHGLVSPDAIQMPHPLKKSSFIPRGAVCSFYGERLLIDVFTLILQHNLY